MVKIPEDAFDNGLGLRTLLHDSFLFQRHEPDGRVVMGIFLAIMDLTGEFDPRVGQSIRLTLPATTHHIRLLIGGPVLDRDYVNQFGRRVTGVWLGDNFLLEGNEQTIRELFDQRLVMPFPSLQ